jgi:hypothetical protein
LARRRWPHLGSGDVGLEPRVKLSLDPPGVHGEVFAVDGGEGRVVDDCPVKSNDGGEALDGELCQRPPGAR